MKSRKLLLGGVVIAGLVPLTLRGDSAAKPTPTQPTTFQPPAASAPAVPAPQRPLPPRVLVPEADGKTRSLTLAKAEVSVAIAGPLARTTMILTFKNDLPRILEGELDFPLPEGAVISGYGLDVNGEMVDGVPVPKEQARIAFETEVRKGVDPGIAEATVGNNFRTRVYPIPANGTRTVKVEYVSDLDASGSDLLYTVPLRWGQDLPFATLRIEVAQNPQKPVVRWGGRESELPFDQKGERYIAEKNFEQSKFDDDLTLRLPGQATGTSNIVEHFTRATSSTPETFFLVADMPKVPAVAPESARATGRRIGLVWDASLSRESADRKRELALLATHLKSLGSATVDVIVLRNDVSAVQSFPVVNGSSDALMTFLKGVAYDGGTNFGALNLGKPRQGENYAYWLVFTDGLGNLGETMPGDTGAPVYALASDSRANHPLLRALCQKSGGAYLNLNRLDDATASATLGQQPFSLLGVTVDEGRVADIYPNGAQPVLGPVRVTGRLLTDTARVTFRYGANGKVTATKSFTLTRSGATETGLVGRYWASQRVASLAANEEENAESLRSLGIDFNLVTPNTSLIVLENLEQYLRYGITPPKSRAKMYAEYMANVRQKTTDAETQQRAKLASVLAEWNERRQWWAKDFKYSKTFRYAGSKEKGERDGADRNFAEENAPAPAAVATPAPPPADESRAPGGAGGGSDRRTSTAGGAPANARPTSRPAPANRPRASGSGRGVAQDAAKKADMDDESGATGGDVVIKAWSPDTPYLKKMKATSDTEAAYGIYLTQRKEYGTSPAFYLDCAEFFFSRQANVYALRVLTNIAELKLEDPQLLRIVAHRLAQLGHRSVAISLFEKILRLRPEEPQSYRDLALTLADQGDYMARINPAAAVEDYKRSVSLLNKVVLTHWDRFEGIEQIALMEANRIVARAGNLPNGNTCAAAMDSRLLSNLTCDVRILMTWDTDQTDMDLWVTEPSGETAIYSHPRTTIGGRMSNDFTQGYGPEEYCLKNAMPGKYRIQTNYFGSRQQQLTGGTTVQATVITNFGRPNEKRQHLTLRLTQDQRTVEIGTITW